MQCPSSDSNMMRPSAPGGPVGVSSTINAPSTATITTRPAQQSTLTNLVVDQSSDTYCAVVLDTTPVRETLLISESRTNFLHSAPTLHPNALYSGLRLRCRIATFGVWPTQGRAETSLPKNFGLLYQYNLNKNLQDTPK